MEHSKFPLNNSHNYINMHVDIGNTMSEVNSVPVVFVLLENKRKRTHEKLFSAIKNLLSN